MTYLSGILSAYVLSTWSLWKGVPLDSGKLGVGIQPNCTAPRWPVCYSHIFRFCSCMSGDMLKISTMPNDMACKFIWLLCCFGQSVSIWSLVWVGKSVLPKNQNNSLKRKKHARPSKKHAQFQVIDQQNKCHQMSISQGMPASIVHCTASGLRLKIVQCYVMCKLKMYGSAVQLAI